MEKREIIKRLRLKESIRGIQKETGYSRELIREIKKISLENGWLDSKEIPSENDLNKSFENTANKKPHGLDSIKNKILEWLQLGYTFVVMTQLIKEYSFEFNEITVRRYIKKNFPQKKKSVIRRNYLIGEIAEVDFGYFGSMFEEKENRLRKVWIFSMRLCYSRYAYRELVFDQTKETFFMCHIHAFEYFGGVPKKVVVDNLKAAVIKACFKEPLVNKSYKLLAEYYDFLISPNNPYHPEHKGGVEKDIQYVSNNFLPLFKERQKNLGKMKLSFSDCKKELVEWTNNIDLKHKVKYVDRTPSELFEEEKLALQKVKFERWDIVEWRNLKVGADWKIQFDNSFYSVSEKYIGEQVDVCSDSKEVVIYYEYEEIARHKKAKFRGERVINPSHAPVNYEEYLQTTSIGVKKWAMYLGNETSIVVERVLNQRGIDGLRPAKAICALSKKYGNLRLNNACKRAIYYNTVNFKSIVLILEQRLDFLPVDKAKGEVGDLFQDYNREDFKFQRNGNYFNC